MTTTSAELLRMLGSVVTPAGSQAAGGVQTPGLDFAALLKQANSGGLSSGREVTIAKGAGVQLSSEQLARVAAAADRAEAQGATRALVMMDGKAFTMDVAVRQITGEADLSTSGVLTGIDAVVGVPSSSSQGPAGRSQSIVPLPRAGFANPSLLRLLGIQRAEPSR